MDHHHAGVASGTAVAKQSRPGSAPSAREWTVMFYLNGVDDLEKSAECALIQMLSVRPTKEVTLTIQLAMTGADAPPLGRVGQRDIPCPLEKDLVKFLTGKAPGG